MSPWSRESVCALLTAVFLLAILVAVAGGQTAAIQNEPQVTPHEDDIDANWTMEVQLQEDGDAVWTISTTIPLSSPGERDAFRELATDFENGDQSVFGLSAFERASAQASESTGREMELINESRITAMEGETENGTGRLAIQFTWENFARTETDHLYVDDVLVTEEGLWLPRLGAGDELVVRPPDGYGVLQANVVPGENATLRWTGPVEFDDNSLQATFIGNGGQLPGDTDGTDDTDDTGTESPGESTLFLWLLGGGAVVFAVGVGAYFLVQNGRLRESDAADGVGTTSDDVPETDTPTRESTVSPVDTGPVEDDEPDEDDIDVELLSDEERVTRLLEENGGRMKQANIVKETDWSNAKVSQLLSSMEDDGKIDKLRIGRENLISFPEEDVADIEDE